MGTLGPSVLIVKQPGLSRFGTYARDCTPKTQVPNLLNPGNDPAYP